MMDEKQLEQEYRSIKQQAAPDLWDRIERNLKEHPEREKAGTGQREMVRKKTVSGKGSFRPAYGMAAAAAAILVLVTAAPVMRQRLAEEPEAAGAGMAAGDSGDWPGAAPEETAAVTGNETAGGGDIAETGQENGTAVPQALAEAVPEHVRKEGAGDKGPGPGSSRTGAGSRQGMLLSHGPLQVPADAVTVAEDSRYFSEGILADTSLLCGARVVSAELCQAEGDGSGQVSRVVYQVAVDEIWYAEDYVSPMDRIIVESPIIRTQGDTAFVLYQMAVGETYLLPLAGTEKEGHYELLYPFAPQIQMVQEQGYLFHSGYGSLVNEDTSVAVKAQEGANDFYYDRMLMREDDDFLSDLIALIEREKQ